MKGGWIARGRIMHYVEIEPEGYATHTLCGLKRFKREDWLYTRGSIEIMNRPPVITERYRFCDKCDKGGGE